MIEVLLALGVIAVGMTTVLGLFPVGLKASRQAVAENSSANVADQMITYMRVMGETSPPADPTINYDYTFDLDDDISSDLPIYDDNNASNPDNDNSNNKTLDIFTDNAGVTTINLDSSNVNIDTLSENFLDEYRKQDLNLNPYDLSVNNTDSNSNFERVAPGWAIFIPETSTANLRRRIYFIVQGPNCTQKDGNHPIDYSAMALVWKDTVQIKRLESDGTTWSNWPTDADIADPTKAYKYSGKVNVELSWPLELPYKDRKKRYYQVVINKP